MARRRSPGKPERPKDLCPHLQPILARVESEGNRVAYRRWDELNRRYHVALEAPMDLQAARAGLALDPAVEPLETLGYFRFVCGACRHSLDSPRPEDPPPPFEEKDLAPDLRAAFRWEIQSGNRLRTVLRDGWTDCPLALTFRDPLQFKHYDGELGLPATVERWECWDSHYAIEAGLKCTLTRHTLGGPPPVIEELRPHVEATVAKLVAGAFADLAGSCHPDGMTPDQIARSIKRYKQRLISPPRAAYEFQKGTGANSMTVHPVPDRNPPAWVVSFSLWTEESSRSGLILTMTIERAGKDGLRGILEDVSDDPLPAMERALARRS